MPHQLSPAAAAAAIAQDTEEVFLACVRIYGPGLDTYRIVCNTETLVRQLGDFVPWPFEVDLPEDTPRSPGTGSLRLENVDPAITRMLRDYDDLPQVAIDFVLASSPDRVERGPFEFTVVNSSYDETTIELQLGHEEDPMNQRVPGFTYTPSNSPGLWP